MQKNLEKKQKLRKQGDYIMRQHFAFTLAEGGRRPLFDSGARHTVYTTAKGGQRPLFNSGARHTVYTTAKGGQRPLSTLGFGKAAFTLAEVLITLAVIGIVAVLTIPALIQRYQERIKVTQLKKSYAVIQQAFQMAIIEHGTLEKWNLGNTLQGTDTDGNYIISSLPAAKIIAYISPYLKKSEGSIVYTKQTSLDGRVLVATPSVSKNDTTNATSLLLADGTLLNPGWQVGSCDIVRAGKSIGCGDFWIYLPYSEQQLGVTMFNFYLTRDGLLPNGFNGDTGYPFDRYCDVKNKSGFDSQAQGRGCTAWVLEKGNMDYLRCDDLTWDGKSRCSD